ncbi:MAG TPA: SUMF1/EgtB/PvdO family nonheme iron enzyme [Dissulfurispiraceae bacterium]|nr:SUMF1/EgtB/PvdO family nonheme iron enzyme [Dissulfurispiraceae bacterium]
MKTIILSIVLFLIFNFVFTIAMAAADKPVEKKELRDNCIAVFDLRSQYLDDGILRSLSESIRRELVRSGKYQVINRGEMNEMLSEQMFQISGCISGQCTGIVEAGRILGAGKAITGSVGLVGKTYYLSLSLIDVKTGNIERISEDKCKCEVDDLIESSKRVIKRLLGERLMEDQPETMTSASSMPAKTGGEASAVNMEFAMVKGGCYGMGDSFGDGYADERPVHEVCVNDFFIGKYDVTQGQWKEIMGDNPSQFNRCGDNCPVENISWNDTQEFIKKLKQRIGKNFRLPTEAEWEYAARSRGEKDKWAGTSIEPELGEYAWFDLNSGGMTHPVGKKRPNGAGLYDMSGNVWEWCQDLYDENYYGNSPKNNPAGPDSGTNRVLRGGSWFNGAGYTRSAKRLSIVPDYRDSNDGFRLVRTN